MNEDWGNGNGRKAYAVEANSDGYLLAIRSKDNWGGSSEDNIYWDVYQLTTQTNSGVTTAIYDWGSIFSSDDISSYEISFKQDLNEDGVDGRDTSNITIKALPFDLPLTNNNGDDITPEDLNDKLASDSSGTLYLSLIHI